MATTKMMTALQVRTKPAPDTNPRASNAINNMVVSATGDPSPALRARAYQTEMYEKSIEDNIIVVVGFLISYTRNKPFNISDESSSQATPPHQMDTGTGKTLVYVLPLQVSALMEKDARHG
jgi:hypothetical protein